MYLGELLSIRYHGYTRALFVRQLLVVINDSLYLTEMYIAVRRYVLANFVALIVYDGGLVCPARAIAVCLAVAMAESWRRSTPCV